MNKKELEQEFIDQVMGAQGIIHKVCGMYCDEEEDRKDLFQDILINLWNSYPSFHGDSKFSTWMYRVSLNVAIQRLRKATKKKENEFNNGTVIYFEHENLDHWVSELVDKGIAFEQMPTDMRYLWREAVLYDPSGNKIKLYYAGENRLNPPWRIERSP